MGRIGRRGWRLRRRVGAAVKLDWLEPDMRELVPQLTTYQTVAACLFGEARSEPIEGIVAVANVIRNRVQADLHGDGKPDWFGEGYVDVVTRPWQFSMWHPNGGKSNNRRVLQFVRDLVAKKPVEDVKARQCVLVAHGIIDNYLADNTNGSHHYHKAGMSPRPSWAQSLVPTKQIAGHVFYNNVK
jgi:N-acetylmuramoyl-L-alanine amidase